MTSRLACNQLTESSTFRLSAQIEISQVQMRVKREEAARYGLTPGDVTELLETLQGTNGFAGYRRG